MKNFIRYSDVKACKYISACVRMLLKVTLKNKFNKKNL